MPHPGERISNPITGERIVFMRTTDETGGECLLMDVELRPGGIIAGAPHRHPFEERFHVTDGRLVGWVAGEGAFSHGAGEKFVVPPDTDHLVMNGAATLSRAQVEARPGKDFDRLLEVAFAFSSGRVSLGRQLAGLMLTQGVRVAGIPSGLQERLMGALSPGASRAPAA
jgi:quercetin dioxygenase-like cupin family protein